MLAEYFQELTTGLEAKLREPDLDIVARKHLALETARLGSRIYEHRTPLAWCGVLMPFELMNALGVTSCFVEFVGAMLASTGAVGVALEAAEGAGLPTDLCSYHRAVRGAALQGWMPEPDFVVATSNPCSGGVATIEALAHRYGKDLFALHIPAREDERSTDYLARQLQELAGFVGAHTGRPLDPDRLREVVECTNRTREILRQLFAALRAVPTPARRADLANFAFVESLLLGTEAGERLATIYRDEMTRKQREGRAGVPGERVRLAWVQNRIQFKNPLDKILEELGAALVFDELNDIDWRPIDPADPYRGMASRILAVPLTGSASRRIERLARLGREYSIDGVIAPCHWGCRQGTGARGLIGEGLRREGFPVLNLEVDCVDPRPFSEGQLRTRLEAFIETLLSRRA